MGVNSPSMKTNRAIVPPKDSGRESGGASKRGCGSPLSCCEGAARSAINYICSGVGRVTQGASFPNRTSQSTSPPRWSFAGPPRSRRLCQ